LGVRGVEFLAEGRRCCRYSDPLTPDLSPPSTGERGTDDALTEEDIRIVEG
jgi:hypothetical protein